MLIDTHCHINMIVKKTFDTPLTEQELNNAQIIVNESENLGITKILNVGTSFIESINSIRLAQKYKQIFASVGIHPNDITSAWKKELKELEGFLKEKEKNKIVAIGECGIDLHYPGYNIELQKDVFKAQIEYALKYDVALIVHSRDGYDETLQVLEEYKNENINGIIHCFFYDEFFAMQVLSFGYKIGIGGPITYPKNDVLRQVVKRVGLDSIVLETDAPFLPPQIIRGKQNHPIHIKTIALFISELLDTKFEIVCEKTTNNASKLLKVN